MQSIECYHSNKMLSETADFAPGDATWQTGRFWFWPIRSIIWRHDVIHKTGCIRRIASCQWRTEPRPQVTCTENLVKCGHAVFEICVNFVDLAFKLKDSVRLLCVRPTLIAQVTKCW